MKKVGMVTDKEKDEIEELYDKKIAIEKLLSLATSNNNNELYGKAIEDYTKVNKKFDEWWAKMGEKYQWQGNENGQWSINFDTCEVFLI
ncbi:CXXX repeat peptide modification system protein [Peptoniphilus sp. HMSC062D09]|uniref:CXXX repeat peptide modification system protein n=1 Tax=Peptoniphilus sp. HMSC062D09 TaxID=1739305 RepID=UPI0008A38ECA|nr:CXXX repeat peptide modification system protein [Peptoniphilus sp. HMSC062D09]OFK81142.1 hypothetical protein HMPREF2801_06050 [Peptoniphilus sp. HMSC062D09]